MAEGQKSSGNKKAGRNKEKCSKYRAMHTREMNKVRRVLKSSGVEEARKYAASHNVVGYLAGLIRQA